MTAAVTQSPIAQSAMTVVDCRFMDKPRHTSPPAANAILRRPVARHA